MEISKNQLRIEFLEKRKLLSKKYIKDANYAINNNFTTILQKWSNQQLFGGYLSINNEVDLSYIFDQIINNGHILSLPIIINDNEMQFYRIENYKSINFKDLNMDNIIDRNEISDFSKENITLSGRIFRSDLVCPDILIVPIIACDIYGNRINYGKGCYDKYIHNVFSRQKKEIISIGVCYSCQMLKEIPYDLHDQAMNYIITEEGIFYTKAL